MNTAWRLAREEFADDAFSGEGARLYGGRWNHKGLPAIYTSECLSLQNATLRGLGLRRMHQVVELEDTASTRGMLTKVRHLVVEVQES